MGLRSDLEFVMISAMYENGGNTTHRFLDGHPELFVYPFESQLGNALLSDHWSSLWHFKYRWPQFPATGEPESDYELFFDEEMKVRVRTPYVSKFRDADIQLDEQERKKRFVELMQGETRSTASIVAAFFRATFDTWKNLSRSGQEHVYVGYSPIIGVDGDRILTDFPNGHVIHVVRNPFSAYAETKHRPFPHSLQRYTLTWNLLQHLSLTYANKWPDNYHILRYEDLVADPESAMRDLSNKLGIGFAEALLYPSWNGQKLGELKPWGTIRIPTPESNRATAAELSDQEHREISTLSKVMIEALEYQDFV